MLTCILGGLIKNGGQQESHDAGQIRKEDTMVFCSFPTGHDVSSQRGKGLLCQCFCNSSLFVWLACGRSLLYFIHQRGKFHFNIAGSDKKQLQQHSALHIVGLTECKSDYCLIPVECLKHSVCWTNSVLQYLIWCLKLSKCSNKILLDF